MLLQSPNATIQLYLPQKSPPFHFENKIVPFRQHTNIRRFKKNKKHFWPFFWFERETNQIMTIQSLLFIYF